jgi:hypothetical protein
MEKVSRELPWEATACLGKYKTTLSHYEQPMEVFMTL